MIKTIRCTDAKEFDKAVNDFERKAIYSTGVSRVFATQTHIQQEIGTPTLYVAVIFYKGDEIEE